MITSPQNSTGGNDSKNKCFFATEITKIAVGDASKLTTSVAKVNGQSLEGNAGNCADDGQWSLPTCASKLSSIEKKDGGYYIYIDTDSWVDNGFVTTNTQNGLHQNCK